MAINQIKGNNAILFGVIELKQLAENSISYEIGESGDVLSANDTIVHLRKNKSSVVSAINVTVVKGAENVNALLLATAGDVVAPLAVRDEGVGLNSTIPSASITTFDISDSTNTAEVETITFTFKGNILVVADS